MKVLNKFFKTIIAIIMIPTIILIAIILWSYTTGNKIKLPSFGFNKETEQTFYNFLTDAELHTEEIYLNGDPVNSGIRGYINISSQDLAAMTPSQYYDFYQEVLKDSTYIWFSIVCPDGTGLFIPDCADGAASFCTLDELGRPVNSYGYLIIQGDKCIYQEAR